MTLTRHALLLPPPIDALVKDLRERREGRALIGRHIDSPWLFPGGRAGKPLAATQLITCLKVHGIRTRPARNTALMDLANQVPTTVISRLLGLHIRTATRWSAKPATSAQATQPGSLHDEVLRAVIEAHDGTGIA